MTKSAVVLTTCLVFTASTSASIGQTSCGSCGSFPSSKVTSVESLERQLREAGTDRTRKLILVGEVCSAENGFSCGELTVQEATEVAKEWRLSQLTWWDRAQKIGLAIIAFSGFALGILNRYRPRS